MPELQIHGVNVHFPFQPYECQITYMEKVIQSVKEKKHAVLESPTGTGKTLCLLCSTLAWQEETMAGIQLARCNGAENRDELTNSNASAQKKDSQMTKWMDELKGAMVSWKDLSAPPRIIFSSRTHAQLSQAIQALKGTVYKSRRVGIIGSRDQLCINPEVMNIDNNSSKVFQCRARVQSRTCEFYNNFDKNRDVLKIKPESDCGIVDIEDLVKMGKEKRCCPYYMSRELKTDADILFMPYNYLLDAKIRRLYNIELDNTVLIFDEAHNIEQVCEDNASVEFNSTSLAGAIEELRCLGDQLHSTMMEDSESGFDRSLLDDSLADGGESPNLNLNAILQLKGQMIELEDTLDALDIPIDGLTKPGDYIFDVLGRAGLTFSTKTGTLALIDTILAYAASSNNHKLRKGKGLSQIQDFLKTVFLDNPEKARAEILAIQNRISVSYRVHIQDENLRGSQGAKMSWDNPKSEGPKGRNKKNRVLSYWCFSPGRTMTELLTHKVRCVILTSGTLYPIENLKTELNIKFEVELCNPHVINSDQLQVAVVTKGPDNTALNSSYSNRENASYQASLGQTIVNFARLVPRGLLVFFPSYTVMTKCVDFWQSNDIYDRIIQYKQVIVEPKDKVQFSQSIVDYQNKVHDPSLPGGAALLAVARGKASEGLDLSDHSGRGVMVVGLPFPPAMQARVKLKMAYLDEQKAGLTGRVWYRQQAWRAVNQSVGRVIRHHKDFGVVLLCDERFASAEARSQLPKWMQQSLTVYQNFGGVIKDVTMFFKQVEKKYPAAPLSHFRNHVNQPKPSTSASFQSAFGKQNTTSYKQRPHDYLSRKAASRLPSAGGVEMFSASLLSNNEESGDYGETRLDEYRKVKVQGAGDTNQPESRGLFQLLNHHDGQSTKKPLPSLSLNRSSSSSKRHSDLALEDRLLKAKQAKRIRLAPLPKPPLFSEKGGCQPSTSANEGPPDVVGYLGKVRAILGPKMSDYQSAVRRYKEGGGIDALSRDLADIFLPADVPGLIRDFYDFVPYNDQTRFRELCTQITGLDCLTEKNKEEQENDRVSSTSEELSDTEKSQCGLCKVKPPLVPVASNCKHVCCLHCWKKIIDQGNKRCPTCKQMTRRRNLVKLT